MRHNISCEPLGLRFEAAEGETLLSAALAHGHILPHSCRSGVCGTCKVKVTAGVVDLEGAKLNGLSEQELADGYVLLCQAKPRSAITVECNVVEETRHIPVRRIASRVASLERLSDDVVRIRLKLPDGDPLVFAAGQHVNVVLPGGVRRCVSLANPPSEDGCLEMHLRNYGGTLSKYVFQTAKENDLLRLEGPLGTFVIRRDSEKPIIFVASGTGFSPIKSMIDHQIQQGSTRPMTLYWGGRQPKDIYLNEIVERWVKETGLHYVPVVSNATDEDEWGGRRGYVHDAVVRDYADLSGHQVYVCGSPLVIDAARLDFIARCNLAPRDFFADEFKKS
jgi:CDP-4-dehydro-6-deoxyglucose reductase